MGKKKKPKTSKRKHVAKNILRKSRNFCKTGKKRYITYEYAQSKADYYAFIYKEPCRVYKCDKCRFYHITTQMRRK